MVGSNTLIKKNYQTIQRYAFVPNKACNLRCSQNFIYIRLSTKCETDTLSNQFLFRKKVNKYYIYFCLIDHGKV